MPKKRADSRRLETQNKIESRIVRPYSGGKPVTGHRSFNWVQDAESSKWVHAYKDPEFIKKTVVDPLTEGLAPVKGKRVIVDFAGGEGLVSNVVKEVLDDAGINSTVVNLDLSDRNVMAHMGSNRKKGGLGHPVRGDVIEPPLGEASVDGAVIRYGLHYFSKADQLRFLKSVRRTLKPGAPLVIYHPHHRSTLVPHVKSMAAASGMKYSERRTQNYFPTSKELEHMAKEAGFKVMKKPRVVAEHWYSPESYADRWGGDDKARREEIESEVRGIFEGAKRTKKYGTVFVNEGDRILKPGHHVVMVLKKR